MTDFLRSLIEVLRARSSVPAIKQALPKVLRGEHIVGKATDETLLLYNFYIHCMRDIEDRVSREVPAVSLFEELNRRESISAPHDRGYEVTGLHYLLKAAILRCLFETPRGALYVDFRRGGELVRAREGISIDIMPGLISERMHSFRLRLPSVLRLPVSVRSS